MLLFEHKQRAWAAVSGLVLVAAVCIYLLAARGNPDWPAGGSLVGLWFGIAGSAMMVFAALLAVRRRFPTLRVGSGEFWLRAHLWIGTLSFLFILLHSGFRLGGPLEQWLWLSFVTVVLSGFFLLFVQQILPNYLTSRVPSETFAEQIPYLCRRLTVQSDEAVAACYGVLPLECEPLRDAIYDLANPSRYGQAKSRQKEYVQLATRIYGRPPTGPLDRGFPVEEKDEEQAARPARGGAGKQTPGAPAVGAPEPGAAVEGAVAGAPAEAPKAAPKAAGGLSPLEKMRAQQAAKKANAAPEKAVEGESTPAAAPLSTVPATVTTETVGAVEIPPAATGKPMSKMEMARAQALAKKAGGLENITQAAAPADNAPPAPSESKPLSKLEQARAQMLAKKNAAPAVDGTAAAAPPTAEAAAPVAVVPPDEAKPLSKLEQARAQMLAKKNAASAVEGTSTTTPPAAEAAAPVDAPPPVESKPLSKLEQARAQMLAKKNAALPVENTVVAAPPISEVAAPAEAPAPSESKPLSKLEQARAQMLAKKNANAAPVADTPPANAAAPATVNAAPTDAPVPSGPADKPLSKIELMRAQAAANKLKAAGNSPVAVKPVDVSTSDAPVPPAPAAPARPTPVATPAPAPRPAPAVARRTAAAEKPQLPLPRSEDLLDFYLKAVRPYLEFDEKSVTGTAANAGPWKSSLATSVQSEQTFVNLRRSFPIELHPALELLEKCCNERRDYRLQQRIRRWLHGCLLLHIPASTALIVFFLIHVLTALRVIPF